MSTILVSLVAMYVTGSVVTLLCLSLSTLRPRPPASAEGQA